MLKTKCLRSRTSSRRFPCSLKPYMTGVGDCVPQSRRNNPPSIVAGSICPGDALTVNACGIITTRRVEVCAGTADDTCEGRLYHLCPTNFSSTRHSLTLNNKGSALYLSRSFLQPVSSSAVVQLRLQIISITNLRDEKSFLSQHL